MQLSNALKYSALKYVAPRDLWRMKTGVSPVNAIVSSLHSTTVTTELLVTCTNLSLLRSL